VCTLLARRRRNFRVW